MMSIFKAIVRAALHRARLPERELATLASHRVDGLAVNQPLPTGTASSLHAAASDDDNSGIQVGVN